MCGYLDPHDISHFKLSSRKMAIECLNNMRKIRMRI